MTYALGIDIGGSFTKFGLFDSEGFCYFFSSLPTPDLSEDTRITDFLEQLSQSYEHQRKLHEKSASPLPSLQSLPVIGVALPGVVSKDASLDFFPNTRINFPLFSKLLSQRFPWASISYLNDANAAALAEHCFGAAQGYSNSMLVTLGTGLGAGIIVNNELCIGAHGFAGEIGHLVVEPDGIPCPCGKKGCLQMYSSASALVELYKEAAGSSCSPTPSSPSFSSPALPSYATTSAHTAQARPLPSNAKEVFDLLDHQDAAAIRALDILCKKLALGLAQTCCVINPDIILIGGGISERADTFLPRLITYFRELNMKAIPSIPIKAACMGNTAGSLGAALFALQRSK